MSTTSVIYYLNENEYGTHVEGTYIVESDAYSSQIQKVEWSTDQWVIAAPPYDAPITVSNANARNIIDNEPQHTHQAAPAVFTHSDEDNSEDNGEIEIFSSNDLTSIGITFFDDSSLTSDKFFSISPNESENPSDPKFYLQEWSNDNEGSVWVKVGDEDGGKSSHSTPEDFIQAFTDNTITAQATVNLNSDQPANLYTAFSLANVGITPISTSISLADDSSTGYAVFTDINGTTKLLKYTKNDDDSWSVAETGPNPIYANGRSNSANAIVEPNLVGTGDVPNPFPDGVYAKSDLQTIFTTDIAADNPATHFALRESHDNFFIFQPVKVEGMEFVVDGEQIKSAVAFDPDTLGNVYPTGSWTQAAASADGDAADGDAADGATADGAAAENPLFGKVFQIDDQSTLNAIVADGHTLSSGNKFTFMMNDENKLIISGVSLDAPTQKYVPEDSESYKSLLKSDYSNIDSLSGYITANTSDFQEVGTMLKRVDATDPTTTINLNDPDFEEPFDPASKLDVQHADKDMWQLEHVYSIDGDAFISGLPDVSGYWIADPNTDGDGVTFTKVIADGSSYIIDDTHTPIHYPANVIDSTIAVLSDGTQTSSMTVQDIASALANNINNQYVTHNINSHDGDQIRKVLNLIDGKSVYSAVSIEFLHGMSVVSGKVP